MIMQIISHTPRWVFVLFFVLLALGDLASRPRTLSRGRVAILPIAMMLLSAYGVVSAFGYRATGMVAWVAGMTLAVLLNRVLQLPRGASYVATTQSFVLPGSWIPLALMLAIFFTKYTVAVLLSLHPTLLDLASFLAGVSLVYGVLSGIFFASALTLWRLTHPRHAYA
jgi:hypothetical protein